MQTLIITEFGVSIGKTSERLVVRGSVQGWSLSKMGRSSSYHLIFPLPKSSFHLMTQRIGD